jgi:hypothetical protein
MSHVTDEEMRLSSPVVLTGSNTHCNCARRKLIRKSHFPYQSRARRSGGGYHPMVRADVRGKTGNDVEVSLFFGPVTLKLGHYQKARAMAFGCPSSEILRQEAA